MGLFSFLNKNKQSAAGEDGAYVSRDDDDALAAKARSKRATSANEPAARRTRDGKAVTDPVLPEKKRARRRLVGAVALALAVAIALPMILDAEPQSQVSDVEIRIPSKEKAPPLALPTMVANSEALDKKEEIVDPANLSDAEPRPVAVPRAVAAVKLPSTRPDSTPEAAPATRPIKPKPEPKPVDKPVDKPTVKPAEIKSAVVKPDAARAIAILEDKPAVKMATQKYMVQVAALQSQEKANELQGKLKAAGIASVAQKSGELIRIRVGPFTREEGDKIRARLVKLGLSGSLVPH